MSFYESQVEEAAIEWLPAWQHVYGPDIAPGVLTAERKSFGDVVLVDRLRAALLKLNPRVPEEAIEDAILGITRPKDIDLLRNNHAFHRTLVDGVKLEVRNFDGTTSHEIINVADWQDPDNNEFLAINQYTVIEDGHNRRPDVVLFLNGLPLAVIELKNAADEGATVYDGYKQLQTYKDQIPSLFVYNSVCATSDGIHARIGTISADWDRFMPWRTIVGDTVAPKGVAELDVLLKGVFNPRRFLDIVRFGIVFERDPEGGFIKKLAGYHQFHAVETALESTLKATAAMGDKRAGVVWHTQGSGKSLTMVFYAGKIIRAPELENPTVVVLTDRNDLDDQLFGTFCNCEEHFQQTPVQAESRMHLRELLDRPAGGIIFSTMQKFSPDQKGGEHPLLNTRRNIVVIADEAHRSQYGFAARADSQGRITYGMAAYLRHALPNASFIGFTGTPIEQIDANTREVFGDYISVYDIQRSVEDKATVPIYYESRLAKLSLDAQVAPKLDEDFDEVTEGEEVAQKEKLKTKWAALEAVVGARSRIDQVAKDLVEHWEERQSANAGKAMIVGMSRRICVELYDALARLRPQWAADGVMNVVMTGSATDPAEWQRHIRSKRGREEMARRFKDENDPFQIVIVRDMWLTGFDVPCLNTMYLDKPMRGHTLMQAIARVNRVFGDKPGGIVVDYLGLADELKKALADYTASKGEGKPTLDIAEAVAIFLEKFGICEDIFHGFDRSNWKQGTP
ncbi:MAG: type I restriction endonuclease subunit R, partial [Armatimonadetes bacterium]|nr:type I restriction endonuclease subunit R [Armatimonadota bacterium]